MTSGAFFRVETASAGLGELIVFWGFAATTLGV